MKFYGYNRIPQTGYFMKNENLFLIAVETGKSKIKALADLISGEIPLLGSYTDNFSLCPHMVEETRELSGVSLIRMLIPFMT